MVAGLIGLLLLSIVGDISSYIFIYLPFMTSVHVERFGSPWSRMFNFATIFNDLQSFCFGLGYIVSYLALYSIWSSVREISKFNSINLKVYNTLKFVMIFLTIPFTVGLGGEYYNHHFIFTIPIYIAFFLVFIEDVRKNVSVSTLLSICCVTLGILVSAYCLKLPDYEKQFSYLTELETTTKAEANYIDQVLDRTNLDRYFFIGFNGPQVYGWTKHSPLGPLFFQNPSWVKIAYFRSSLIDNLNHADLVVVSDINQIGDLQHEFSLKLDREFSEVPWPEVKDINRTSRQNKIYFRNRSPEFIGNT